MNWCVDRVEVGDAMLGEKCDPAEATLVGNAVNCCVCNEIQQVIADGDYRGGVTVLGTVSRMPVLTIFFQH